MEGAVQPYFLEPLFLDRRKRYRIRFIGEVAKVELIHGTWRYLSVVIDRKDKKLKLFVVPKKILRFLVTTTRARLCAPGLVRGYNIIFYCDRNGGICITQTVENELTRSEIDEYRSVVNERGGLLRLSTIAEYVGKTFSPWTIDGPRPLWSAASIPQRPPNIGSIAMDRFRYGDRG